MAHLTVTMVDFRAGGRNLPLLKQLAEPMNRPAKAMAGFQPVD